jgi:hypothetical protein
MPKQKRPLVREGEPSQRTKTGLEIPIVKTEDFDRLLRKAATKRDRTSEPGRGKR